MSWAYVAVAGATVLGGIAGGKKKQSTTSLNLAPASALELQGGKVSEEQLKNLQGLVNAGPGQESITQANQSGNNLAELLQRLQATGGMGNAEEQTMARDQASQLFAPQQEAVNQGLEQSRIQASRASARMGRQVNDPILNAKLAQERANQQGMIEAQKTSFAAGAGQRSLDMGSQLFNLRQGIASQAMSNRQNLFAMGQQATAAERDFRIRSAGSTTTSGGGQAGQIGGALAGFGAGMSAVSGMGGFGGGGGDQGVQSGMPSGGYQSQARGGGRAGFFDSAPAPIQRASYQPQSSGGYSGMGSIGYQAPQQPGMFNYPWNK